MNKLHIIYRACDKIIARGNEENLSQKASRPFTNNKTELVKVCFTSLKQSLAFSKSQLGESFEYDIHVIGDCLSDDLTDFFTANSCNIIHGEYGNDNSLRECFKKSLEFDDNDWLYFCEDDYLHTENTINAVVDLIAQRKNILQFKPKKFRLVDIFNHFDKLPLFIHPTDYPDRYFDRGSSRFSLIFQSPNAPLFTHWRQIQNTTFTFFCKVSTVRKFEKKLFDSCYGAHDGKLSRIYRGAPHWLNWAISPRSLCLSPIPSLAAHLHPQTLPIGGNWQAIYKKYLKLVVD